MTTTSAFLFDFTGTLFDSDSDHEAHLAVAQYIVERYDLDVTPQSLNTKCNRLVVSYLRKLRRGEYASGRDVMTSLWSRLATLFGVPTTEAAIDDFVDATRRLHRTHARPVPGALALVEGVRALGLQTALVSQIDHDLLADLLDVLGLTLLFDTVCSAEDVHVARPQPAVIELTLTHLGVEAKDAVMVGDDVVSDIEPARRLGMTTIHFHEGPAVCPCPADFHCPELSNVLEVARSLRPGPKRGATV